MIRLIDYLLYYHEIEGNRRFSTESFVSYTDPIPILGILGDFVIG